MAADRRRRLVTASVREYREGMLFDAADEQDEQEYVRELIGEYAASLDEDRRYLLGTYRFVDMARRVVGVGSVGSVGMRAWVFLFVGRSGKDPLVLQAKEAQASVLEPYLGASTFLGGGSAFERAIATFSTAYADQNELDYQRLTDAVAAGDVQAEDGV